MKVLIAGGAGYIGGVTSRLFEKAGHQVTVFDNLSTGHRHNIVNAELVVGDLLDTNAVNSLFKKQFDVILDFAANIQVEESVKQPLLHFRNNSVGPLYLVDAALAHGIKNFIFSSTAAVYGEPKKMPVRETDLVEPINPYGWSKLLVEQILKSYSQVTKLNWVAFRYFNVAGAYESIGPEYPFMTHLIPSAIKAMDENRRLKVFGSDYDTKDGTCVRDFIHVHDVARAHVLAAEKAVHGSEFNQPINLGSDHGFSVLEVIGMLEKVANQRLAYELVERRPGDPAKLIANNQRAKKLLGWAPDLNLQNIISDSFNWYQSKKAN